MFPSIEGIHCKSFFSQQRTKPSGPNTTRETQTRASHLTYPLSFPLSVTALQSRLFSEWQHGGRPPSYEFASCLPGPTGKAQLCTLSLLACPCRSTRGSCGPILNFTKGEFPPDHPSDPTLWHCQFPSPNLLPLATQPAQSFADWKTVSRDAPYLSSPALKPKRGFLFPPPASSEGTKARLLSYTFWELLLRIEKFNWLKIVSYFTKCTYNACIPVAKKKTKPFLKTYIPFANCGLHYSPSLPDKRPFTTQIYLLHFSKTYLLRLFVLLQAGVFAWNWWVATFCILTAFPHPQRWKEQIHWCGCVMHLHWLINTSIYFIEFS